LRSFRSDVLLNRQEYQVQKIRRLAASKDTIKLQESRN
jgi:hypothetical protein